MSILDDIMAVLQGDDDLVELLTGGLHSAMEISRQLTPTAFDGNQEILPCALVKTGDEIPIGPHADGVQTPIAIYLYQRVGHEVIETADQMIFGLLHRQKIGPATWRVDYDGTVYRQYDDALQCPMMQARYHAIRRKV